MIELFFSAWFGVGTGRYGRILIIAFHEVRVTARSGGTVFQTHPNQINKSPCITFDEFCAVCCPGGFSHVRARDTDGLGWPDFAPRLDNRPLSSKWNEWLTVHSDDHQMRIEDQPAKLKALKRNSPSKPPPHTSWIHSFLPFTYQPLSIGICTQTLLCCAAIVSQRTDCIALHSVVS